MYQVVTHHKLNYRIYIAHCFSLDYCNTTQNPLSTLLNLLHHAMQYNTINR